MEELSFKVIVIGPGAVGKSSIIRRFVEDKFTMHYKFTIGVDFSTKSIDVKCPSHEFDEMIEVGKTFIKEKKIEVDLSFKIIPKVNNFINYYVGNCNRDFLVPNLNFLGKLKNSKKIVVITSLAQYHIFTVRRLWKTFFKENKFKMKIFIY